MRFFFADPGLLRAVGHHPTFCRLMRAELRARQLETKILGHRDIDPGLKAEFDAMPFFRANTYWLTDSDPVCGWLNAFEASVAATTEDLERLTDICADDIIYFSSVLAAQVFAVFRWVSTLPIHRRPRVVMEFGIEPGLQVQQGPQGLVYSVPDARIDPRPTLFRFVGSRLRGVGTNGFHLATFHAIPSHAFSAMLNQPVGVLPFPYHATKPLRRAPRKGTITISAVGHQGNNKGYQFWPQIADSLLSHPDVRIVIHNCDPGVMPQVDGALRRLAEENRRLEFYDRSIGPDDWENLIAKTDLMVCPYDPARYRLSHSGVVVESIANAIPIVVPGATALAALTGEFGGAIVTFDSFEPRDIVTSIETALRIHDDLVTKAVVGAQKWANFHGVGKLASAVLALPGW